MENKSVYVNNNIWRLKKLNFVEKIILSDMINLTNNGKEYKKKKETIANDFGVTVSKVENSFKKLGTLDFISTKKKLKKNREGKILGCQTVFRKVNDDKLSLADRFTIKETNIFTKKYPDFSFNYSEIRRINSWNNKNTNDGFLALHIIINKNLFFKGDQEELFCRFKKTDLYEVLGVGRPKGKKVYDFLTNEQHYTSDRGLTTLGRGRILDDYDYENEDVFEGDELEINIDLLNDIGMMFDFNRD